MKIKILHLIESLSRGGAENRLVNDLKNINKDEFAHSVCYLFEKGEPQEETLNLKIPVYGLKLKDIYQFHKCLFKLIQIIRLEKPNIIHTQLFAADIYGRILGKLLRIPVVSTIQSSVYEPGIEYFRSPKRRWLDSFTGRFCNTKFIAVSNFVKESIIKRLHFKEEDIEVIYNYIDVNKFSFNNSYDSLRKKLGLNQDDIVLITIGKLNPPKGHRYLFEALPSVIRQSPSTKLLVVGDGPDRNKLLKLRDNLKLERCISFLGVKNNIQELLSISNVFVFPSLSEGFPLSLIEAMSMKIPCIAFNTGPMPEAIENGKTGILVEPKNSQALADAIITLANNSQKTLKLSTAARKSVFNNFSALRNAEKLMCLYKNILDNNEK